MKPEARIYRYEDIQAGMKEQRDYEITAAVFDGFVAAFEDHSPIHVDEAYALECGFAGRVAHGGILNGFLSHFVGMHFPGKLSLLLAADLRYAQPSYIGDVIRLEAVAAQKLDARRVILLDTTFTNLTRGWLAARGRVQVMLRPAP